MKQWFSRGKKPTEAQFAKAFDSFYHKTEDRIGINDITSLQQALDEKAEVVHRHAATDISGLPETDNEINLNSHNPVANSAVALALAAKASVRHTHVASEIDGLSVALANFVTNSELAALVSRIEAIESHVWRVTRAVMPDIDTGCNVTFSQTQACVGDLITVTVTCGEGYLLDGIEVETLDSAYNTTGQTIPVGTEARGATFTFAMPFADVMVMPHFVQRSYDINSTPVRGGTVTHPASALGGDEVTISFEPDDGYEFVDFSVVNDTTGNRVPCDGGEGEYTFTMPASSVTINAVFAQTEPTDPDWGLVDTAPGDWSGEYILASVDDNMMAIGNLSSYQIACGAVRLRDDRFIPASEAANAKKFTIGNRYFVQTGAYSGRYAYTITYQNANNETKYLTYSASGLSNGTSINNNTRWYIELDPNRGKVSLINIGSTTTRLYFYTDHIQQLTASNHDSISQDYHKLSLFKEEAEAQAAE